MEVILKRSWKLDEMLVERLKGLGDPVVSSVGMPSASPSPFPLPAPLPPCVSLLHPSSNPPCKKKLFPKKVLKAPVRDPKVLHSLWPVGIFQKEPLEIPPPLGVGSGNSRTSLCPKICVEKRSPKSSENSTTKRDQKEK